MRLASTAILLVLALPMASLAQADPTPVEATLQSVLEALEGGSIDRAISLLEEARDNGETDLRILGTLGDLYLETGRADEALALLAPLADSSDAEAALLYTAGRAAVASGELEQASGYLERSLQLLPVSPAAREMGFLKLQLGDLMEAYLLLRPWNRLHAEDFRARMAAASCAIALGRAAEAEELLTGLPSDDPRVKILWGRTYLLKEDGWGALAMVKPMTEEAPEGLRSQALSVLAAAYLRIEQPESAIKELEGKTGEDPDLVLLLSRALFKRGDLDQALSTLEPVAKNVQSTLTPESSDTDRILGTEIAVDYGRFLAEAQRHSEAITFFELATRLDPLSGDAWELLGQSLAAEGRDGDSERALARSRAILKRPDADAGLSMSAPGSDATGARLRQALVIANDGQPEEALKIVRQEQILVPEDSRPMLLEARLLLQKNQFAEARGVADRAVQTAPDSADAYYVRGTVLLNLGLSGAAEEDLRRAIGIAPQHTAAMNDLAVLLMVRGDKEEARQLLQQVLALNPEDALAAENLQALDDPTSDSGG